MQGGRRGWRWRPRPFWAARAYRWRRVTSATGAAAAAAATPSRLYWRPPLRRPTTTTPGTTIGRGSPRPSSGSRRDPCPWTRTATRPEPQLASRRSKGRPCLRKSEGVLRRPGGRTATPTPTPTPPRWRPPPPKALPATARPMRRRTTALTNRNKGTSSSRRRRPRKTRRPCRRRSSLRRYRGLTRTSRRRSRTSSGSGPRLGSGSNRKRAARPATTRAAFRSARPRSPPVPVRTLRRVPRRSRSRTTSSSQSVRARKASTPRIPWWRTSSTPGRFSEAWPRNSRRRTNGAPRCRIRCSNTCSAGWRTSSQGRSRSGASPGGWKRASAPPALKL
mmetsp:Transcript_28454/g.69371  ORF Transcript_28454/g.69371 Transcript_28454/m.69371 type:complete len:334 (-) Transcript_28454:1351-2352(-)